MKALIVAGGIKPSVPLFLQRLRESDLSLAADRGLDVFEANRVQPDILIGDLDSASSAALETARRGNAEIIVAPREKDETDLELAARIVYERDIRDVCILGATGGRVDHLLGNLSVLRWLYLHQIWGIIEDDMQTVQIVSDYFEFHGTPGESISIIPAAPAVTVSADGLRYPLRRLILIDSTARGLSNVIESTYVHIESSGPLFLIRNRLIEGS